ncbi:hypothetical protein ACM6N5_05670 [Rossellomorea marisflavi]
MKDVVSYGLMCSLAVEAHELPAESEVLHRNHERFMEQIVFVMK